MQEREPGPPPARVTATPAVVAGIDELMEPHGLLTFRPSVGSCEGSSPTCCPRGASWTGHQGVLLGD